MNDHSRNFIVIVLSVLATSLKHWPPAYLFLELVCALSAIPHQPGVVDVLVRDGRLVALLVVQLVALLALHQAVPRAHLEAPAEGR